MKRFITMITMVTLLVTIAGFSALAAGKAAQNRPSQRQMNQPMSPEGQMDPRRGPQGRMFDDAPDAGVFGLNWRFLDLSDEQRTKIKEMAQDVREKIADLRQELKSAQQDLRDEIKKETVDQAQIDKLLQNLAALKNQVEEATTQHLLAIKGVLTPEQLDKLAEAKAKRDAKGPLNDEQREKVDAIMKAFMETINTLQKELRDLRDQFQDLLLAKDTDQAQLKQIQEQIAAKEAALEKAQVDRVLQIKAVLTPEQFKQFERGQAQWNQPDGPMQDFQEPGQMMPGQGFQGRQFQSPQGFEGQPPQGQFPRRRGQF